MPNFTVEQKEAINTDGTNIIVSAGAGSGKTAVLTSRVIRKLKEGININELLILTFTKAAASEMKERIRKEIKEDASLKKQLDLIDSAYITTFDSFALSIVKKYHYLIGVNKDIGISDSTLIISKRESILDEIFNDLYTSEDKFFLKLIDDFCVKDDKEIREYILNLDDKLNLKIDKKKYLENYIKDYFNSDYIDNFISEYVFLIKEKQEEIKEELEDLFSLCDGDYYTKLEDSLKSLLSSNTYEEITQNLCVKLPSLPRNTDDEIKFKKQNISDLLKKLEELCKYENTIEMKDKILLTLDYVTIIIEIIQKLDNKFKKIKKENNLYEFSDIVKMSIDVLKDNEDVREEVKNSFKEIMIDEYQDTNDLQEYFISLIQNKNVYMVGDIKQSIYRFRNANPEIFKNKYLKYSDKDDGIKIDLNKNFRSRKEVLDNINLIFDDLMDINIGGADYKNGHQMIFGNLSYEENKPNQKYNMEVLLYDDDKKYTKDEIEFFKVARDIKTKMNNKYQVYDKNVKGYRDICYSDFCLLMDRSSSFTVAKKIFEYLGIPLTIIKDDTITSSYDIAVIRNIILLLIKDLKKEVDDEYKYLFISLARSFIFEYPDDVIFKIVKDNKIYDDEIIKKIKRIYINNLSITEILNNIIKEFNLYENFIKLGNIHESLVRLEYLNNIAKTHEDMGYDIYDFGEYLKEVKNKKYEIKLPSDKSNSGGVKIMTIHASKGLEFPVCYFLGLYKEFNIREMSEKFNFSNKYGIITPYYSNGIGKTIYSTLLKNDYIKDEISEKIRLFYVALTRTKEKIIFILPSNDKHFDIKRKIKFKSFADFVYALDVDKFISKFDYLGLNITRDYNLIRKENVQNSLNKIDEKMHFQGVSLSLNEVKEQKFSKDINNIISKKEMENISLGREFHECLEYLDFLNPNLSIINNSFLKNKVQKFLESDLLKDIYKGTIYKESEFKYLDNDIEYHGILDLLIEYDDHIDIIDYKLKNVSDDSYIKQLSGYKKYINLIKKKNVNVYLYSIIDENFMKID